MSRIAEKFQALKKVERKALIPYITAGDPDLAITEQLIIKMAECGADIIELGVPFSDPMADGPVIQRATERALTKGIKLVNILDLVGRVRKVSQIPIVLFSYFNPLLQFGLENLAKKAKEVGIDAILVTDLSPEESENFLNILKKHNLDMIFLLAPTSSDERMAKVAKLASGFIYAVSRTGITGMQQKLSDTVKPLVSRIRNHTNLPIAVGFGISNREQVKEVCYYADGAVVGSRIVAEIEVSRDQSELVEKIGNLVKELSS
ncbi:MAG: tryptophan synthase subunit alpha [Acidobacteria bacterium]|nr:tryptophan synthase subunit alpha [Acidobacteriota bacterium]